jgi:hypothetical protein
LLVDFIVARKEHFGPPMISHLLFEIFHEFTIDFDKHDVLKSLDEKGIFL